MAEIEIIDVDDEAYNHLGICNTLNLFEEQCPCELQDAQRQVAMATQTEDCNQLNTFLESVQKSLGTPFHYMNTDMPSFFSTSDIQFHNVQNYDTDTFHYSDQVNDSEDEMLTVHFEQENVNTYVCQVCHKSYKYLRVLQQHELTHVGENSYKCSVCSYVGKDKIALRLHMLDHTHGKSFRCHLCDYNCSRPYKLKNHLQYHTNNAPNKCSVCQYSTFKLQQLNLHLKYHHLHKTQDVISPETQVDIQTKQYICEYCAFMCDSLKIFKTHLKEHSDIQKYYTCDLCQKNFTHMSNLKTHKCKHLDSQHRHNISKHLLIQSSDSKEHKGKHLLTSSEPNQDSSLSNVLYRNKHKITKRNSVRSFRSKTHGVHSSLHRKKRMLPNTISINHSEKKLKMPSHSKSQNIRSFPKKTDSVLSPLKMGKEILHKNSSSLKPGEKLTKVQRHKQNVCEFCGSSIHTNSHEQAKVSSCDRYCNTCKSFGKLEVYVLEYSSLVVQSYKCTMCEYSCKMLETLNKHKEKQHAASSTTFQPHQSSHIEEKVCNAKKTGLYRCVLCEFKSEDSESMQKHLLNCNNILGLW